MSLRDSESNLAFARIEPLNKKILSIILVVNRDPSNGL